MKGRRRSPAAATAAGAVGFRRACCWLPRPSRRPAPTLTQQTAAGCRATYHRTYPPSPSRTEESGKDTPLTTDLARRKSKLHSPRIVASPGGRSGSSSGVVGWLVVKPVQNGTFLFLFEQGNASKAFLLGFFFSVPTKHLKCKASTRRNQHRNLLVTVLLVPVSCAASSSETALHWAARQPRARDARLDSTPVHRMLNQMSRTEQSRAEQSRAEQSRAEQSRAEPPRRGNTHRIPLWSNAPKREGGSAKFALPKE
eukprot:gene215-biopygen19581